MLWDLNHPQLAKQREVHFFQHLLQAKSGCKPEPCPFRDIRFEQTPWEDARKHLKAKPAWPARLQKTHDLAKIWLRLVQKNECAS